MRKVDQMIAEVRAVIGGPYLNLGVMMEDPPADPAEIRRRGTSCSGIWNWARRRVELPCIGGTPAWANNWFGLPGFSWEYYDPNRKYPVGTFLINDDAYGRPDRFEADWSHMMMVSTEDQYVLQSDSYWGINERKTHPEQHGYMLEYGHGIEYAVWYADVYEGAEGSSPSGEIFPHGAISLDELMAIMPNLSGELAVLYLPYLCSAMWEFDVSTVRRKAAFLANLAHESGEMRYFEELADGSQYEGRTDLGNVYPGDGVKYKGRGPIQLTGRNNYRAAGYALGLDLEANPGQASSLEVGFRIAGWFWGSRELNYFADSGDFDTTIYRINGGWNGYHDRWGYYNTALNTLSVAPSGGDIMYGKYNFVASPDSTWDSDLACSALAACKHHQIPNVGVFTGPVNVRACSLAAYWAPHRTHACIVVGRAAHDLLDEKAKPFDDWRQEWDIWRTWDPKDDTGIGTLRLLRNRTLPLIAEENKANGLIETFDRILRATDVRFTEALKKL